MNDDANPCFGCGPRNPLGLRLAFARQHDGRVTTTLLARPEHQGWPGRLHSGVLYTAMLEVANWTLFACEGRVGLPVETGPLELRAWVPVGASVALRGEVAPAGDAQRAVRVTAEVQGKEVAGLRRAYLLADRATFAGRMGYDALPDVLDDLLPPPAPPPS